MCKNPISGQSQSMQTNLTGGTIGEVSVEWYARIVQSNATKDQDYIADGAVVVFEQGVTRRG